MNKQIINLKGTVGQVPVRLYLLEGRYHAHFPYDEQLKNNIKVMKGSRWNNETKCWTFTKCRRNDFQLAYLMGLNPYEKYDEELRSHGKKFKRLLFDHQMTMVDFMIQRQECIVAAEMGTGKTLAGIELLERVPLHGVPWWVGPKLTLSSVAMELDKWECMVVPELITYDKMKRWVEENVDVPNVVIFDESSKLKGYASQRTKSAIKLGNRIREKHGDKAHIILFSGRPAPNAPVDWWGQAEVACPGFLREGKYAAFEDRLCYKIEMSRLDGAKFRKIEGWWDNEDKCQTCHCVHSSEETSHPWVPSVNEVEKLKKRLRGLVLPIFIKDCIDLPSKNYLRIKTPPNARGLMLARQIRDESLTPGEMMYKLRAVSDGYVVKDVKSKDTVPCPDCMEGMVRDVGGHVACHHCNGEGVLYKYHREYVPIKSPKIQAFAQVLDNYSEHGRLIAWAPLHGTLDLLRDTAGKYGWNVLQFDGRKVAFHDINGVAEPPVTEKDMLRYFQEGDRDEKCLFIGNPEAAGMGLTLTAADAMVFYSNSWKPEARTQAESRIHRPGSLGARIIDIVCMPIDEMIREALIHKDKLQDMSLGKLQERLIEIEEKWDEDHSCGT